MPWTSEATWRIEAPMELVRQRLALSICPFEGEIGRLRVGHWCFDGELGADGFRVRRRARTRIELDQPLLVGHFEPAEDGVVVHVRAGLPRNSLLLMVLWFVLVVPATFVTMSLIVAHASPILRFGVTGLALGFLSAMLIGTFLRTTYLSLREGFETLRFVLDR